MTRRAIVVGGSISGLFAACLLRQKGWQVDVYERSDVELKGRGAGIVSKLETVFGIVQDRLVEHDEEVSVEKGKAVVRASAVGRRPVLVRDLLRMMAVGDVDQHHSGVAPSGIGYVSCDNRMMEPVAAVSPQHAAHRT
jgi:flavin-dependent dehydrogenase